MADRAVSQEERVTARTGAMRSAWMVKDYQEIISVASGLIAESKLAPELANEAHYYRAKALLAEGQNKEAAGDLAVLAKDTRNVYGAEAKYLLAQLYLTMEKQERQRKRYLII